MRAHPRGQCDVAAQDIAVAVAELRQPSHTRVLTSAVTPTSYGAATSALKASKIRVASAESASSPAFVISTRA